MADVVRVLVNATLDFLGKAVTVEFLSELKKARNCKLLGANHFGQELSPQDTAHAFLGDRPGNLRNDSQSFCTST